MFNDTTYKNRIANYHSQWTKITRDPTLAPLCKVVLYDIKIYRNERTGSAWPSMETLAKNQGKHRNTISPTIKELLKRRLLITKKHGFKNQNEYSFCRALDYPRKSDTDVMHSLLCNYEGKTVGDDYFDVKDTKKEVKCTNSDALMHNTPSLNAQSTVQELNPLTRSMNYIMNTPGSSEPSDRVSTSLQPLSNNIKTNEIDSEEDTDWEQIIKQREALIHAPPQDKTPLIPPPVEQVDPGYISSLVKQKGL